MVKKRSQGSADPFSPAGKKIVAAFEEAIEAMRSGDPTENRRGGRGPSSDPGLAGEDRGAADRNPNHPSAR